MSCRVALLRMQKDGWLQLPKPLCKNGNGRARPLLTPASEDPASGILVVAECERRSFCLLVDEVIGKQEVVVKNLGETFKHARSLAGATILGDGRVGLILNVDALVRLQPDRLPMAA